MPTTTILGDSYATIEYGGREWTTANSVYTGSGLWWNASASDNGYGRYYTYTEILSINALLSSGWRVPLLSDWRALRTSLGADAGGKLKRVGLDRWLSPNAGASDLVGFNLFGAGYRHEVGIWRTLNEQAMQWSSDFESGTPYPGACLCGVYALYTSADLTELIQNEPVPASLYMSLRFVRDIIPPSGFSGVRPARSGSWRNASEVHVMKDGVWRKANRIFVPVSGVWREVL